MLDFDRRITLPGLGDVAIYPDHQRPRAFYAIPNAPRLARDDTGAVQLSLVLYGRKQGSAFVTRGGLLTLSTSLQLSSEEEQKVRTGLARRLAELFPPGPDEPPPQPEIASPDWLEGEVEVQIAPDLKLSGKPSLYGSNQCSLSINLNATEAEAASRAWAEGLPKALVSYRLTARTKPSPDAHYGFGAHSETTTSGGQESADMFASVHVSGGGGGRKQVELTGPLVPPGLDLAGLATNLPM